MISVILLVTSLGAVLAASIFWFGKRDGGGSAPAGPGRPADPNAPLMRIVGDEPPPRARRFWGRESIPINVDPVRCARFGFCEHEAPDVFQIRREGRFTYKSSVPVEQADAVVRAAEVCPARAIRVGKVHSWERGDRSAQRR